MSAFVRDRCKIDSDGQSLKTDLWKAWKEWCDTEGARSGTNAILIRNLRAAYPSITPGRPEIDGKRVHVLYGISLATTTEKTPDTSDGEAGNDVPSGVGAESDSAQPSGASGVSEVDPAVFVGDERETPVPEVLDDLDLDRWRALIEKDVDES